MMEWVEQMIFAFQDKDDFDNQDNHNQVVQFHENLGKVGTTKFVYVYLEKEFVVQQLEQHEFEECLEMVALMDFASY